MKRFVLWRVLAAGIILAGGVSVLRAEKIPALAEIPAGLPREEHAAVSQERETLRAEYSVLKSESDAFNELPAEQQPDSVYSQLQQRRTTYIAKARVFNAKIARLRNCLELHARLARDQQALETMRKTIGQGLEELDAWTKSNEDAQKKALEAAVNALFGGLGEKLISRAASARSYKGWLERYRKQIADSGIPFEALESKIELATRGYTNAIIDVTGGKAVKNGLKASDAWELVKNEIRTIQQALGSSDASIRELASDPQLKKIMSSQDPAYLDFTSSCLQMASDSKELAGIFGKIVGPGAVSLEIFIRDYGYNAYRWEVSREQIIQQANLTDKELQAVGALKKEIEATEQKIRECEGLSIPNVS